MSKNDYYIDKWAFLLEGLPDKKREKYKMAKLYENSSMNNSFSDFKLIVSILYKFFKTEQPFSLSNSRKNKIKVSDTIESYIFDYNKILIDFFENFTNESSITIKSFFEQEKLEKINHLKIDHEDEKLIVSIVY